MTHPVDASCALLLQEWMETAFVTDLAPQTMQAHLQGLQSVLEKSPTARHQWLCESLRNIHKLSAEMRQPPPMSVDMEVGLATGASSVKRKGRSSLTSKGPQASFHNNIDQAHCLELAMTLR